MARLPAIEVKNIEQLWEEAAKMSNTETKHFDGITVVSGDHPAHDHVDLIFPATGPGLILPIVIRK